MVLKASLKGILCFSLCLSLVLGWLPTPEVKAATSISVVDWDNEKQVMDGLGGAFAFNKAAGIKQIYDKDPVAGRELLDLIFSHDKGIGLNIVRTNLGDGGIVNAATKAEWGNRFYDGPTDTIWPEKNEGFVWDQPDWASRKAHFDEAQVWIMKEAMAYGVKTFYADAWSPPYWMKTNSSVLGQSGAKLKADSYQDYADYLVQYAIGYKREFGIPITHIGPANESEAAHGSYSGFVITAAEYKDFMQNYLGPTLQKAIDEGKFTELGMNPPLIVAPEGTNLNASLNLGRPMLEDPASSTYIDVFSTHLYGTSSFNNGPLTSTGATGAYPDFLRNFKLWQTEFMTQNTANSSAAANTQLYANQTITDGVKWANLLTNMFTSDPGFNSFLWWWPIGNNGADGSDLIRLATTGSPQGNGSTVTGLYRTFKRLYTFGNFSRFINPGDIRIDATRVPVEGVNISAYKNPANNEFSIIAVNSGAANQVVNFKLNHFPTGAASVVGYRTSASENQKLIEPVVITDGSFEVNIPANSVITFVPQTDHNLPGLTTKRDIFSTLEAEDNDGESGPFNIIPGGANGALSNVSNGSYIKFANINFGDGSANGGIVRRHVLSMNAIAAAIQGGFIEVRIDDPATGRVVGTFNIPGKGSGDAYSSYPIQIDTGDKAANGYHDVYMVFHGNGNALFHIDRFEFDQSVLPSGSILTNGSFEDSPAAAWERAYGATGTAFDRTTGQNYSAPPTAASSTTAYSAMISNREEAANGIAQVITDKVTTNKKYKVNGFFMPSEEGTTGKINLVALDSVGKVVYTKTIAERSNLEAMVWSQIDSIFTYESPSIDYETLKIVFTNTGTNALYVDEVTLVPYTENVWSIRPVQVSTNVGAAPHLPNVVTAVYSSGSESQLPVIWDLIDPSSYAKEGSFTVNGTVEGVSLTATATVTVLSPPGNLDPSYLTGPAKVSTGEVFDVTFGLNGYSHEALAQDMTVTFNTYKLDFIAPGSLSNDFKVVDYKMIEPGKIRFLNVFLGGLQTDPNGALMKLQFKAKPNAEPGDVDVTVLGVVMADQNGVEHEIAGTSHHIHISAVEKQDLTELIAEAEGVYASAIEGKLVGQYPIGSKAALDKVIRAAIQIANDASATQSDVDQSTTALTQALQLFRSLVIVAIPGDINHDNRISVGDLSKMVKAYGKSSSDPDWNSVMSLDLNQDGFIDIVDLAQMAKLILNW
ncbi:carbohydrate-binding protein [Paenibacillus sp. 5J-6]|uniref:Carbohydrate-binding protein n=1 Tax=Paenibacillus silvestris TaxID=2606219 RepID=A0A6L8V1A1_9BACL|nr:Ig-like domain-containing protein [Paenibacillus silvestris]MZQ83010.1 carbohydrate-binding protein [Paenibacillus silvestris]